MFLPKPIQGLGLLVASVLVFSACTNDDSTDDTTTTSTLGATTTTQSTDESPTKVEPTMNIVELAQETADLSTLVAAVTAGELVDTLSNETAQFTVFAPTNEAFASIQETVDTLLLPENQTALQNVLTYHVVPTAAMAADLSDGDVLTTVQGTELNVRITDGKVYINGAMVTAADIEATNGVVHVIDQVLVPAELTIAETAVGTESLSTLVAALTAADLVDTFATNGAMYTVFAPTNDAFAAIQETVDTLLLPENVDQLTTVLTYHVVPGRLTAAELEDGQVLTTLAGETLEVGVTADGVTIGGANVALADVATTNGVVHVIDTVLVP